MRKKISLFLLFILLPYIGFLIGQNSIEIQDWYPRLAWAEFFEGQDVTQVYVENGLLYVGTEEKVIPHILKTTTK